MNKSIAIYVTHVLLVGMIGFMLIGCGAAALPATPTPDWHPTPTYIHEVLPSPASEYTHYVPSEGFNFDLEFEYPSYWLLEEDINESVF